MTLRLLFLNDLIFNRISLIIIATTLLQGCAQPISVTGCDISSQNSKISEKFKAIANNKALRVLVLLEQTPPQRISGTFDEWMREFRKVTSKPYNVVIATGAASIVAPFVFADTQTEDHPMVEKGLPPEQIGTLPARDHPENQQKLYDDLISITSHSSLLDMIDNHSQGDRILLVAASDLSTGDVRYFDLSAIAATRNNEKKKSCFVAAILAAAATPVYQSPVYIDGTPYITGNTSATVLPAELRILATPTEKSVPPSLLSLQVITIPDVLSPGNRASRENKDEASINLMLRQIHRLVTNDIIRSWGDLLQGPLVTP